MFFITWREGNWRQTTVLAVYVVVALTAIIYSVLSAANASELFSVMSDICGTLIISGIMIEGAIGIMVMALGIIAEAKERARAEGIEQGIEKGIKQGREEGREQGIEQGIERTRAQMIATMRDAEVPEADIQKAIAQLDAAANGHRQRPI